MMKLLLTGAEGFTGKHFAVAAKAAGYEVEALISDLTDAVAVTAEVARIQPQYVVHLAALSSVTHADEESFYRVNLFGTLNLLNALCALPVRPKKVLLASSANVYGNTLHSPITEECVPKPVNHYAMSKLAMEMMAANYLDRLPVVIARPFNYTGLGHDTRFVVPKIVDHFKKKANEIELGNLQVEREYNDVRMVCATYLRLLASGESGQIYNVASCRAVSLREVIGLLENITGQKMLVKVNPAFVRANEVHVLVGSAKKLESFAGPLEQPSLKETLHWMLHPESAEQTTL